MERRRSAPGRRRPKPAGGSRVRGGARPPRNDDDVPVPFGEASDRLVLARVRVRVPDSLWTGQFGRRHPRVRLQVLNRTELAPGVSVGDHWIDGATPGGWQKEIESYPDVLQVELLSEMADGCLYRITFRNPGVIEKYRELQLPLPLPLWLQGGFVNWEIAARPPALRELLRFAHRVDPRARVLSLRRPPLRAHLPSLSEAQHVLLAKAMRWGYFAVPRGCTLTELARRLHRSKSTVSESMAVLEKKLIESAVANASPFDVPRA